MLQFVCTEVCFMRLERMTWPQAETYFRNNDTVIIPLGSIESHGRHMPLGTDILIPDRILELFEQQSDTMIAPDMPYGCTDYLADFPGTVNLGHDVLYQVMSRICESLRVHGARRFVILNGHGGNIPVLDRVALDLQKKGCILAEINWWQMVWKLVPDQYGNFPWSGGHGSCQETSAVMAVDPSLVDPSEIRDAECRPLTENMPASGMKTVCFKGADIPVPRFSMDISDNGWFGNDHPKYADAEWGMKMIQASADYIAEFIEELKKAQLPDVK